MTGADAMTAAAAARPLVLHAERVRKGWIDYNGHMHEAYYVLVFGNATDALYDHVGFDRRFRETHAASIYTLEAHVRYLSEVGEGAPLTVTTQLLGLDDKRLHLFHAMYGGDDDRLLATEELMLLHVATAAGPRAAPFPPEIANGLTAIAEAHAGLPWPDGACARIGLGRAR